MNDNKVLPDSYLLLEQEGYLISSCLTTGLTELRRANIQNKGAFYSALFNLSIGIERLLKSLVIVDHMLTNQLSPPSKKQLKKYGHNIYELYETVVSIGTQRGSNVPLIESIDPINQSLMALFSDFAQTTRYHNLDAIGSTHLGKDPLEHWGEIILAILKQDTNENQLFKILSKASDICAQIENNTIVFMHGLDKQRLSLFESLALPGLYDQVAKHAVLRIVTLLSPIKQLSSTLSDEGYKLNLQNPPYPDMQDFLTWMWNDRQYVLRKKRWP